jgi:hypothetical protein
MIPICWYYPDATSSGVPCVWAYWLDGRLSFAYLACC